MRHVVEPLACASSAPRSAPSWRRYFAADANRRHPDAADLACANKVIWTMIAMMFVALCISFSLTGLSLQLQSAVKPAVAILGCLVIAWVYRRWRPDPWIATGAESIAQISLITTLALLLSYAAAALAMPYCDAELHSIDTWLGFDNRAYLNFFNAHPRLASIVSQAYASIRLQFAFVVAALLFASRFSRLQEYLMATIIALVVTLIVFIFTPARAFYAYLGILTADYPNLSLTGVYDHVPELKAVRDGTLGPIDLDAMQGLITFPSFHTTAAILFTWAVFPLRKLRWWIATINALMIAATPMDGSHYFIDILGGSAVAAGAIILAGWLRRSTTQREQAPGLAAQG